MKTLFFQLSLTVLVPYVHSQLEAGSLKYTPASVDLKAALDPVIHSGRQFVASGVQFKYHITDSKFKVKLDQSRISQIITNGLSNAGKFTRSGCVSVYAGLHSSRGTLYLVIDISNTANGDGLPSDPEELFVPFKGRGSEIDIQPETCARRDCNITAAKLHAIWQSSTSVRATVPYVNVPETHRVAVVTATTGLGLPLSRSIAMSCGGWLALEAEGDASHFW